MFFEQYSHEPNIAVARHWLHYLDPEDLDREQLAEKQRKGYHALDIMEGRLAGSDFLVGAGYSIADMALYAYTHVAHEGGFELNRFEAINIWLERIRLQPGHIPITHG